MPAAPGLPGARPPGPRVYTVSELVGGANRVVEQAYASVWVEGEVSNLRLVQSGHAYFTLKDAGALLPVAMWRSALARLRFRLQDGQHLRVMGRLGIYPQQGKFQLYAERAEPAGLGAMMLQLEQLRARLAAEGLFARERKRPLPRWPRVIGVVTSPTGAAIHDILKVTRRRCPSRVLLAPAAVQGDDAPASLRAALLRLQARPGVDVIIIGRGGGASEDLWAFNDEAVVRAIAACRVPIVSAVGHEVDVTLADFAADVRAATPSNAAELVVPEQRVLEQSVQGLLRRLERAMEVRIGRERLRLERRTKDLEDPRHALAGARRKLDATTSRLAQTAPRRLVKERGRLLALEQRLLAVDPRAGLARDRQRLAALLHRLERASRAPFEERRRRLVRLETQLAQLGPSIVDPHRAALRELAAKLDAMSPLRVLDRGYAIALHEGTGKAVRKVADVKKGDAVKLRLSDGTVHARIDEP